VKARIGDIKTMEFPRHARANGEAVVAEGPENVPFDIARMFTLRAPDGATRGAHAHLQCSQLMLCVHGAIDITCDDGAARQTFPLRDGHIGLLVPPAIWNIVTFRSEQAVLAVLCDRRYEADDYIRSYPDFLAFRKGA
jgi:dTDP-4-dehydrorhamnose 3,5-epimerase-like enzyme